MPTHRSKPTNTGASSVLALLANLDHPHQDGFELLRSLILALDKRITEEVKWNAPSFKLEDHFATFKLRPPKNIQLVLHTGAKVKSNAKSFTVDDPDQLLKWAAGDRCVLTLASTSELRSRQSSVQRIINQWIAQL
jgi:predicted transport protein